MRARSALVALFVALVLPSAALAEDAAMPVTDASTAPVTDASTAPEPASMSGCQSDSAPAGHEVRTEIRVAPQPPVVGDRVIITYRFHHRAGDSVEFEPDPAAFAQPGIEMEYARQQPERERGAHGGSGGTVYGEVRVAVQPFRTGEVVIPPQLARLNAAGDIARVCTPEVRFRVRDPFGNDPHPTPRDVTPPVSVSIDALTLRKAALALDGAFVLIAGTLLVSTYLRRRPRPVAPPPPPRPPWDVALESLDALARSDLLSRGLTKDYYDAISDVIRRYVGAYRGFDALEMTTDEVLAHLRRNPLPAVPAVEIEHLLSECDLVKFARYVPSHEQSENILSQAYGIVRRSAPSPGTTGSRTGGGPGDKGSGEVPLPAKETRRA